MRVSRKLVIAVFAGLLVRSASAIAQSLESPLEAETLTEALRDGRLLFGLRPRYTWVDQSNQPSSTHWASLRTTLGWQTLFYLGLRVTVEAIDVRRFDAHNAIDYAQTPGYAGSIPGGSLYAPYGPGYYARVADTETTDFNRLQLEYAGLPQTTLRAGRQLVRMDNQRFVGDYDATQLPQVFNGVSVENQSLSRTTLSAGYFARVRNGYGAQWQTDFGLLNGRVAFAPELNLTAYGYFQNQATTGSVSGFDDNSNRIVGGRAWGDVQLGSVLTLTYSAELANQDSFAGGDSRIHAAYWRWGAGVAVKQYFARFESERLGSNDGVYGFQTPLGSTQLFTGRADMFATTPRAGLRDVRGSVGGRWSQAQVRLDYHRFRSDWNNGDLGHEWDAAVSWSFAPSLLVSLEYADYRAGNADYGFPDTRKVAVTLAYAY